MVQVFKALLAKELLVLSKDTHGLLALFMMPAVFILIMSLAMQNTFSSPDEGLAVLVTAEDESALTQQLLARLREVDKFRLSELATPANVRAEQVGSDHYKFALVIPEGWGNSIAGDLPGPTLIIQMSPTVQPQLRELFLCTLDGAVNRLVAENKYADFGFKGLSLPEYESSHVFLDGSSSVVPTAVQQSVPAWLVFAMFFVVIPISTAYIVEREQGSLLRLYTLNITPTLSLGAKVLPYYLVNQLQMVLMLLVGIFAVPLLSGDRLTIGESLGGLWLISSATSLAAIGFALLVSVLTRTTIQATTVGGIANVIFGALGGVMVPKFVMPQHMQDATVVSPMSWAMEGFLDVFLRHGQWQDVLPETLALLTFGLVCLSLSAVIFKTAAKGG